MFYIFSVLEVLLQDLSVTRILHERHKDTHASQGLGSRAPEGRALHHDRVQPGSWTIQSSTSNNIPEWGWFHQLFQVLSQQFHFTLLNVFTDTLSSHPPPHLLQVWCTEEGLLCTMTAIQRCLCTRSAFPTWMNFKRSKRGSGKQGQQIPDGEQSSPQGCRQNSATSSRCFEHELWVNIWEESLSH